MGRVTIPADFVYRYRAPGYNVPEHGAMFVSQWAHMLFIGDILSYSRYILIQNLAYKVFDIGNWEPT